jgi:hypothetical protein
MNVTPVGTYSAECKALQPMDPDLKKAIENLQSGSCLTSDTSRLYCEFLENVFSAQILKNFLFLGQDFVETITSNKSHITESVPLFIPYVFEGWWNNHIVLFMIDFEKKTIFYFDSKSSVNELVISLKDQMVPLFFPKIAKEEIRFVPNTVQPQGLFDFSNCGVFVLSLIKEMVIGGKSFEEAVQSLKDTKQLRDRMVQELTQVQRSPRPPKCQ